MPLTLTITLTVRGKNRVGTALLTISLVKWISQELKLHSCNFPFLGIKMVFDHPIEEWIPYAKLDDSVKNSSDRVKRSLTFGDSMGSGFKLRRTK